MIHFYYESFPELTVMLGQTHGEISGKIVVCVFI